MKDKIFVKRMIKYDEKYFRKFEECDYSEKYEHALLNFLIKNKVRFDGYYHQYGYNGIPIFSDDTYYWVTQRTWGQVMANVWNYLEGTNKYSYEDFYLGNYVDVNKRFNFEFKLKLKLLNKYL